MGIGVTAVSAPNATIRLFVWPRRLRPLIRGADRSEVEAVFPGWDITDVRPSYFGLPETAGDHPKARREVVPAPEETVLGLIYRLINASARA